MSSLAPQLYAILQATADSAGTRIVVEHSWLDTLANLAQSLVSLLVLVMLVVGVALLFALKKSIDELTKLVKSAHEPLRAALAEAREVTGEVRAIAKGLKAPLAYAGETIDDASDRVRSVMDVVEGRLNRFDELIGIAQESAEGVVIGAASLMRGVKAGGAVVRQSLKSTRDRRPRGEYEPRRHRHDDADEGDDASDGERPRIRTRTDARR